MSRLTSTTTRLAVVAAGLALLSACKERRWREEAAQARDDGAAAKPPEGATAPPWQPVPAQAPPPAPAPTPLAPSAVAPGVVTALDGLTQVTLPAGWSTMRAGPDDPTHLHAQREDASIVLQITSWPKEDLVDNKLASYAARRQAKFLELQEAVDSKSTPLELRLDGHPTIATEVRASLAEWKFVYVLASVETPKYFFFVVVSATPSKYGAHRDEIFAVLKSFHALAP